MVSVVKIQKLILRDDPSVSMITRATEADEVLNLNEFSYVFALQKIDPSIGRVKAFHVYKKRGEERVEKEIDLVSCSLVDTR